MKSEADRFADARLATVQGLVNDGLAPDKAERWADAWEAEAGRRGIARSGEYWREGWLWIERIRTSRRQFGLPEDLADLGS